MFYSSLFCRLFVWIKSSLPLRVSRFWSSSSPIITHLHLVQPTSQPKQLGHKSHLVLLRFLRTLFSTSTSCSCLQSSLCSYLQLFTSKIGKLSQKLTKPKWRNLSGERTSLLLKHLCTSPFGFHCGLFYADRSRFTTFQTNIKPPF